MRAVEYKGNIYRTPTAHRKIAIELGMEYAKKKLWSWKEIVGHDRGMALANKRAAIVRYLLENNLSDSAIAYAIAKDRTSVVNYKKEKFDKCV